VDPAYKGKSLGGLPRHSSSGATRINDANYFKQSVNRPIGQLNGRLKKRLRKNSDWGSINFRPQPRGSSGEEAVFSNVLGAHQGEPAAERKICKAARKA